MTAAPRRRAFLRAEWRYLLMLNYEVDPAVLAPLVPAGTVLDLYEGRALASVVGFRFLDTRVLGVPVPFHRDFDEVNLRFYVRRELPGGEVRRAATFVRELVPRRAVAAGGRDGRGRARGARGGVGDGVVAEHYWGYTRQRDGGTVEYQVAHPPWRPWVVEGPELDADVRGLYGAAFEGALAGGPAPAFVAEGSGVAVYPPRRVEAESR